VHKSCFCSKAQFKYIIRHSCATLPKPQTYK